MCINARETENGDTSMENLTLEEVRYDISSLLALPPVCEAATSTRKEAFPRKYERWLARAASLFGL